MIHSSGLWDAGSRACRVWLPRNSLFSALWFPPLPLAGLGTRGFTLMQPSGTMKEVQVLGTAEQQEARRHLGPHDFVETRIALDHLPSGYSHV